MRDWKQCDAVERTEGKVSGAWVFKGTRVPVKALFENLESGARIDDFLEWFPGVTRHSRRKQCSNTPLAVWLRFERISPSHANLVRPGRPGPAETPFDRAFSRDGLRARLV